MTPSCDGLFGIGPTSYTFISCKDWFSQSYAGVSYADAQTIEVIQNTVNVTNVYVGPGKFHCYGVDAAFLGQRLGRPIPRLGLEVAAAAGLGAAYHAALAGNTIRVTAPALHLAPTASIRPPVQRRVIAPRPERGWAGVPANRLNNVRATLGQPLPKRLPVVPGGPNPTTAEVQPASPLKPFAVPQPVGVLRHPRTVTQTPRYPGRLSAQPLPPHLARSAHPSAVVSFMRPQGTMGQPQLHPNAAATQPANTSAGSTNSLVAPILPGPARPTPIRQPSLEPGKMAKEPAKSQGATTNNSQVALKTPSNELPEHRHPGSRSNAQIHRSPAVPEHSGTTEVHRTEHRERATNPEPHVRTGSTSHAQSAAPPPVLRRVGSPPQPSGTNQLHRPPPAPKPTPHAH
ncbi:MAG: hypothetical protein JO069_12645 [Verrucomicrobia bacterium]|nr:hypothetical protein [Verrucomicrobiota bacterium]